MSSPVPWQSAYYALIPIAMNTMLQPREPSGKICNFDPSLRIYLRSSPIVCVVDSIFILIRFIFYMRHRGPRHSLARAAREIRAARGVINKSNSERGNGVRGEASERLLSQEFNGYLLYTVIGVSVVIKLPQLMVFSGGSGAIQWTQTWAWLYFSSWLIVEITYWLSWIDSEGEDINLAEIQAQDRWIAPFEKGCGIIALLLQLGILATVDMKAIPPDPIIPRRWWFRGVRFAAHFAVCIVHLPFLIISWKIDKREPIPSYYMGILLFSIIVPHVTNAGTQESRFSSLYFMISVMISYFSWMLYFFPWTKKWVLFCDDGGGAVQPGDRIGRSHEPRIDIARNPVRGENRGWQNVLAFDFFVRIVVFSASWYAIHYDETGTRQPGWIRYLP